MGKTLAILSIALILAIFYNVILLRSINFDQLLEVTRMK